MVLIGGAGTVSGTIMGAFFISLLPRLTRELPALRAVHQRATPPRPRTSSSSRRSSTALLIIVFLLFEPRGLFGIWVRIRNYWKALAVHLLSHRHSTKEESA